MVNDEIKRQYPYHQTGQDAIFFFHREKLRAFSRDEGEYDI